MPMTFAYDPRADPHRSNPEVHYRLVRCPDGELGVACVQDFDYWDYNDNQWLSNDAWDNEAAAEQGLVDYLTKRIGEAVSVSAELPDLMARLRKAKTAVG